MYRIGTNSAFSAAGIHAPRHRCILALALLPPLAVPARAVTVHLDAKDTSSTVLLHVGDRLRLDLPAAPATGYRWKPRLLDASHLETLSKGLRPDTARADSTATQVFVWKAISPGQADIALDYTRPDDARAAMLANEAPANAVPARRVAIRVEVAAGELAGDDRPEGPVPIASYAGTLECGDCLGIAVALTLYALDAGQPSPELFVQRWRYQGASGETGGGDRTEASTGKLTLVHGTYADPQATVYVLDGENFRLEKDRLVELDRQMLPVHSSTGGEIFLRRLPESASSP